ncbi:hypothetical protein [Vibrio parahaemolyticus]
MTVKLKTFFSYSRVRKKTKVEKAIYLANTIDRKTDPLRHLYILQKTKFNEEEQRSNSLGFLQ